METYKSFEYLSISINDIKNICFINQYISLVFRNISYKNT